jgi:hypothetical protein
VIGLDLKPETAEIDAAELRKLSKARCAQELPEGVEGKVRLTRVRSFKALVRVGDGPGGPIFAETGQQAEITPLMDPTRAKVGSDIALEAAVAGTELEDARIFATCAGTGETQEFRPEEHGHIRVTAPGLWRVEFHHLERGGEGWTLTSATLTFEVPPERRP